MNSLRKRNARALWVTSAVAIVVTVATAWWLGDDHLKSHRDDTAVLGTVLVSRDGRTLTTSARWTPCQEARPQFQARESSEAVSLVLRTGTANLQRQCPSTDKQITTTITSPLGTRRLVDASTGSTVTPFNVAELAHPGYLPPGYEQSEDIYEEPPGERCLPTPFIRADGTSWTRFYRKGTAQPALAIAQTVKGSPSGVRGTLVTVDGHPAYMQEHVSSRCLTWSRGTYTFTVLTLNEQLGKDQLMLVAEQLNH